MSRRAARLLCLAAVLLVATGAKRVRLFDGEGQVRTLSGESVPVADRLADDLHVPLGERRSVFFRGLTLAPGEEISFTIGRSGALRMLRWIEAPGQGGARGPGLTVRVDGRVRTPLRAGELWRVVEVPTDARKVQFHASQKGWVRLGEPILTNKAKGPAERPDLLLITIDTLRRDALSIHGGPEETMPAVVWFSRDAVLFRDAIAPSSWTLPSFAGLFTGRHPEAIGAVGRFASIPADVPTITEALAAAGYRTHAIAQNVMLSPDGGFSRGFDTYDFYVSSDREWRSAEKVTDLAIEWLATVPSSPTFLWLHYFDPHSAYSPAPEDLEPFGTREGIDRFEVPLPTDEKAIAAADPERARALYHGEVRGVDRAIGRLLRMWESAGRLSDTAVVITSDHGEEFLEHGRFGHGHGVYEEGIRVPLIVRRPRVRPEGMWIDEQVTLLDLAPTIAEMTDVPFRVPAEPFSGRSLGSVLAGRRLDPRPELVVANLYPDAGGHGWAIREGTRKWTFAGDPAEGVWRWDLRLDPGESSPRAETDRAVLERLSSLWRALVAIRVPPAPRPDAEARLRSLGYAD